MLGRCILILGLSAAGCSHDLEDKWSYSGDHAPYRWGQLDESFRACAEGKRQSPINLSLAASRVTATPVLFSYEDLSGSATNDGKTIRLEFRKKDSLSVDGKTYYLRQIHFHAKSEHSLEGVFFPAELHLVHEAEDKDLLVLGFFIKIDEVSNDDYGFFKELPKRGETKKTRLVGLRKLAALNGSHFVYHGSLTTPPCTEDVKWVIFERPIVLSTTQLAAYSSLYPSNYRPLVPIDEHEVYYSK